MELQDGLNIPDDILGVVASFLDFGSQMKCASDGNLLFSILKHLELTFRVR
jgi:hypothetical protein